MEKPVHQKHEEESRNTSTSRPLDSKELADNLKEADSGLERPQLEDRGLPSNPAPAVSEEKN